MSSQKKQQSEWRIIGTSTAGSKHLAKDIPCQDAFHYKILPDGTLIIAVSDGAGSAEKAREGSDFVSMHAVTYLEDIIDADAPSDSKKWEEALRSAFLKTRDALEESANESEALFRDYSATLIMAVLTDELVIGGMVGDCAAVALKESDELFSLCKPQKGEYANVTNFITHRDLKNIVDVQVYRGAAVGIGVFTDGLAELALNISENSPHAPFFHPLFNFVKAVRHGDELLAEEKLATFLNSERVNARTDDDKTLVLAVKI